MMLDKFEAILFDCDGTLVDTEERNCLVTIKALELAGAGPFSLEYAYENWVGRSGREIKALIEKQCNMTLPDLDVLYKRVDSAEFKHKMKDIAGARAVVAALYEMSKPIAVVTNGTPRFVIPSLEAAELAQYFNKDFICTVDTVQNPKPAPDLCLLAADRLGVRPEQCLVIEDSPTGVKAGVAAGATVWGFNATAHDKEKIKTSLLAAGAERVFSSYAEIAEVLGIQLEKQAA